VIDLGYVLAVMTLVVCGAIVVLALIDLNHDVHGR
jgi:hypothetical protein